MADLCFKCGAKLDDTFKFCRNCGTPVRKRETEDNVSYKAANPTKCVCCGAELKATAKFCPSCGKQQTESTKLTQTPKQTYAKIPGPIKCECCGAELKATAKFCANCGEAVAAPATHAAEAPAAPSGQPTRQEGFTPRPNICIPEEFQKKNAERDQAPGKPQRQSVSVPRGNVYIPEEFAKKNAARNQAKGDKGAVRRSDTDQPAYGNREATPKSAKSRKGLRFLAAALAAVFLFTAFVTPGFLRRSGTGTTSQTQTLKTLKTEKATVSKENPVVTLCGVTVDVVPYMLDGKNRQVSVSKLENSVDNDGVRSDNYELSMGAHENFKIPVEVTFPCTISADTDPTVEHYNEETGEWEPLISFVDEQNSTVTAVFGSFSPARVSYLPIGINPKVYVPVTPDKDKPFAQKLAIARNYWQILKRINPAVYSDEINKFIKDPQNYTVTFPQLDEDMDLDLAYEEFTKASTVWTFCDPLINIGLGIEPLSKGSQSRIVKLIMNNSESIGNAVNVIPFVMMSAQLALDIKQNGWDPTETSANLYKNLITSSGTIYSMVTGFSHIGFTLAFFGISLFGMEMDYFIETAKAEQYENISDVFEAYYRDIEPFDEYHWYQVFYNAYWKNDGNADGAMLEVKKAVDQYCEKFWNEVYDGLSDDFWFAANAAGYKKVFTNATKEERQTLTEQQKLRVWRLIESDSMPIIRRFLLEQLQANTLKELAEVTEAYNKDLTFEITEKVSGTGEAEYTGCTVCLGSDGEPFPDWHINIPDDDDYSSGWSLEFNTTVYSYMRMGMPNQVLIYSSEEDFKDKANPEKIIGFTPVMDGARYTVIEIATDNGERYEIKSHSFTGYQWINPGFMYNADISKEHIDDALNDAVSKATFKLDKNGDFSVSSSGGYSEQKTIDTLERSYNIEASITLKGHIDKGTGKGTFEMSATVTYLETNKDSYYGDETVSASITFEGSGEFDGGYYYSVYDETFDPVFAGYMKITIEGTETHVKGDYEYSWDSQDPISETEEEKYFKITFIANN